jgi:hypothetical protein
MAKEYWGINRGQHETDVVVQGTDPSTNLEVSVDLTASMTKEEVVRHLYMIINRIVKGNWPPA